ncbi:hypothetical protein FRB95_004368 [Tulasnella sp. JGI-2019a]|nr:hypothetical protein FRB95_004368 [Tulasnella sp. JGI-2019a]
MPICVNCGSNVYALYTQYESAYNLRLEQCSQCQAFADPYVEHDTLTVVLDLILLKKAVFLHLIFNRGSEPRRVTTTMTKDASSVIPKNNPQSQDAKELDRYLATAKLGTGLVILDAVIRCSRDGLLSSDAVMGSRAKDFAIVLAHCIGETIVFHTAIASACYVLLPAINKMRLSMSGDSMAMSSAVGSVFKLSHVPLTILYSSLTKFFLLSLLSIWSPGHSSGTPPSTAPFKGHPIMHAIWTMFDETVLDREWIVRNMLGGMAAGFGLRVVLDCHPIFITIIIGVGWVTKVIFTGLVYELTTPLAELQEDGWMKYSIP